MRGRGALTRGAGPPEVRKGRVGGEARRRALAAGRRGGGGGGAGEGGRWEGWCGGVGSVYGKGKGRAALARRGDWGEGR